MLINQAFLRRQFIYIFLVAAIALAVASEQSVPALQRGGPDRSAMADSLAAAPTAAPSRSGGRLRRGAGVERADSSSPAAMRGQDEMPADSSRQAMTRLNRNKVDLEDVVTFSAKDSLVMLGQSNAYLYGESTVEYTDLQLNSGEIRMSLDSATVYATGVRDSVGNLVETPIFRDKSGEYESETMTYNFKTQRGFITDVITQQGEGYLTGGKTKRMEDGCFFVENGFYTTCDNHEHPHFGFHLTRAKVTPKKNIVTGPVYMVLADVPLPLALPFGFFPFNKEYSSGIIMPTFGDDYNRGFYLRDGGYYFAINDNIDLALRGEIYTRGSWGVSAHSNYVKRYRYRGNFDLSYITTIYGDKGDPDYQKQKNFRIAWTHTQDPKANPNLNFSASVNFTTSGYTRNDLNSYYNNSFTENTKSSTVNLTYRFPNSKWSVSATANITQRNQDETLAVSFPNFTVTMSQLAPFKRKRPVGAERWYEKIKMSYTGQFQNSLTAKQDVFFQKSLIKDWRNGLSHSLPISATFNVFKYINVSPNIRINDRMYTSKIRRQWDTQASREVQDTTFGFYNLFDFNASISLDTKIYGFYKPLKIFGDKVQMVRHVITPTVSFSGAPDFSAPGWGIYGSYSYVDADGRRQTNRYNYFSHGLLGSPSGGTSSTLSVQIANNLEMKVKSDQDSTGYKKISLIENFTIGQSYNFAADSMNWSNINTSLMLRLVKNFNLSLSATWDPYTYRLNSSGSPVRVNVPRRKVGKGWARLASTGTSFSYTFNNNTFRRKKGGDEGNGRKGGDDGGEDSDEDEDGDFAAAAARRRAERSKKNEDESDEDGYAKWSCPWSLTVNYSVNYGYGDFDTRKMEWKGKWTQNLSFSGNIRPTTNWNFSFSASYNFDLKKIAYMNCSISRDLHCFTMTASFVPVGPYKSYNFHIAVKSSLLQDLKYDKRSSNSNGIKWY